MLEGAGDKDNTHRVCFMRLGLGEEGRKGDARFILRFLTILRVAGGLPETIGRKSFLLMSPRRIVPVPS